MVHRMQPDEPVQCSTEDTVRQTHALNSTAKSLTLVKDIMQHSTAPVIAQHTQHRRGCTAATKADVNAHELW